jgi:hypothetical protein
MNITTTVISLVLGYVLGTVMLYLSLRVIAKAQGHFARTCLTYLAMLAGGALVGGATFYVAGPMDSLGLVTAFVISMTFASLSQWVIGSIMFRRMVRSPRPAVAVAVIVLYALGCFSGIPVVTRVEQISMQARQFSYLRHVSRTVLGRWFDNEAMGLPVLESLEQLSADTDITFYKIPISDLEYLPMFLTISGVPGPYQSQSIKPHYPLLWFKTSPTRDVPVAFVDGSCRRVAKQELETMLKTVLVELADSEAR